MTKGSWGEMGLLMKAPAGESMLEDSADQLSSAQHSTAQLSTAQRSAQHSIVHSTAQHSAQHSTAQHSAQHSTAHSIAQLSSAQHSATQHSIRPGRILPVAEEHWPSILSSDPALFHPCPCYMCPLSPSVSWALEGAWCAQRRRPSLSLSGQVDTGVS